MSSITDEQITEWLRDGTLLIGLDNPKTLEIFGRTVRAYEIGASRWRSSTRWAFGLRHQGKRRTIVRSKLVYMAGSLSAIPKGFEVHHLDGDRYNDAYDNLIMLTEHDHKKIESRYETGVPF